MINLRMKQLLKQSINTLIYLAALAWYYTYVAFQYVKYQADILYYRARWSCWNPWAVGSLNLAWGAYIKTPMYEERRSLRQLHTDDNFEDYGEQAFVENNEVSLFFKLASKRDKLKLIFAPFSFGNKYRIPFYIIKDFFLEDQDEG